MADNVAITEGAGTTIATDQVDSAHYQLVKLVDGTLDSTAGIPGDATYGLDVDVTRLAALTGGTANIGDVDIAEKAMSYTGGQLATSGNLVAAPGASTRIVVSSFLMQNETGGTTTMILRSGTVDSVWRCFAVYPGDGLRMTFPAGREWRCGTNDTLGLVLDTSMTCGYALSYYTEGA